MITRCDHCGSKFEVSTELVFSNDPAVRCGECLSLFDARANLFDEAEYRKSSSTLKPVQKNRQLKRAPESESAGVDSEYLETADTIAVEHIYTSAGVRNRAASESAGIGSEFNTPYSESHTQGSTTTGDRHREYRVDSRVASELEFERTRATETGLPDRADLKESNYSDNSSYRSERSFADSRSGDREFVRPEGNKSDFDNSGVDLPSIDKKDLIDREFIDQGTARRKKQNMRDREQRALRMEPERDYKSLRSASDVERESTARDYSARGIDRELARETRHTARHDNGFIPDDVLNDPHGFNEPRVLRDNGRRSDADTRFRQETPHFQSSLPDAVNESSGSRNTARAESARVTDSRNKTSNDSTDADLAQRQGAARREIARIADQKDRQSQSGSGQPMTGDRQRDSAARFEPLDDLHSSQLQHLNDRKLDKYNDVAIRNERPEVSESSAQEMRRYQHYRPEVQVSKVEEPSSAQQPVVADDSLSHESRTVANPRSGAGAIFWLIGLVVAVGLLAFAARSVIANMNLPTPVISAFCQVTGCVPTEARKDLSQLEIMRQRLSPHPDVDNAIIISVDVVNHSIYKQPLPTLAVSLLNDQNESVAERNFDSAAYEIVEGGGAGFLMPGEPTRLKIEIVDDGLQAEGVELAFE